MSVFTIELAGGEKVLPVFGHVEEAEMFLRALGGNGWQIRETGAGELVSVLFDPYANVRKIALDPLATGAGAEVLVNLVSLGREDFVELLMRNRPKSALGNAPTVDLASVRRPKWAEKYHFGGL